MNRMQMRFLVAATLLTGCATAGMNTTPANIPSLEQKVAAQPDNADAATSLGIAYYNAKRFDDARTTLSKVVTVGTKNGNAYLYLGLADEELKDWSAAKTAYEQYLNVGTASSVKEQIRNRLAFVARQQLKQDAQAVLSHEQQISQEPPTPRTVAVMPFKLVGTSEDLAPLQTALSDMIITDLSVSPAITSIERVKVNAMVDEMLLSQAGLAEPETGARVGRLLKAENVVQGVLAQTGDKELRMDATVLNTARAQSTGTFGQNEQTDAIFDLEKAIVFNIFNTVGVTLTAAEREKINENRTGSLLAFLNYGRGLESLDKGNYSEAATFFRQASVLDPNFQNAKTQQVEATQLQQAQQTTTTDIANAAAPEVTQQVGTTDLLNTVGHEVVNSPGDDLPAGTGAPSSPANAATNTAQNQSANTNTSTGGTNSPSTATKATIVITIPKPGT